MQSSRARLLPTFPTLVRKRKRSFAGLEVAFSTEGQEIHRQR
jgi:hypothetical protein